VRSCQCKVAFPITQKGKPVTNDLNTVRGIVDAFGGPTSTAKALNEVANLSLTKNNVANWLQRDNLPAQYDVYLVEAARRVDFPITYESLAQMRALVVAPA